MAKNGCAILEVVPNTPDDIVSHTNKTAYTHSNTENAVKPDSNGISNGHSTWSELTIDDHTNGFSIKVDNPQKHLDTLETFVTFRVTTKVLHVDFDQNEYTVRRRYNDFAWLRQKLVECHRFCIIPPLPAKHTLIGQLDRYCKEFILNRMRSLNIFMARLVRHPLLNCNPYFKIFITAKQPDFNLYKKQGLHPTQTQCPVGSIKKNNIHCNFKNTKLYLDKLSEKLFAMERICTRLHKERLELATELSTLQPVLSSWAQFDGDLSPKLQTISGALGQCATVHSVFGQSLPSAVDDEIRDLISFIDVVQDTLHKRDVCQDLYEMSDQELNKRYADKERLSDSKTTYSGFSLWGQSNISDKLEKLESSLPQLIQKVETRREALKGANESLQNDLQLWNNDKNAIISNVLFNFANVQAECCKEEWQIWQQVLHSIQRVNNSNAQ